METEVLPFAMFHNVLQCFAMFHNVLQSFAKFCNVLQCFAMFCNVLQCSAMFYNVVLQDFCGKITKKRKADARKERGELETTSFVRVEIEVFVFCNVL